METENKKETKMETTMVNKKETTMETKKEISPETKKETKKGTQLETEKEKLETKKTNLMKKKNKDAVVENIPDHPNILNGPDIWICDSGCATHMTPHKQGFNEIKYGKEMNMSGCIVGKTVNCDGNGELKLTINNVRYTPEGKFNFISEKVLKAKGWLLYKNSDSKWLEKDGRKILFDIKVSTSKGMLYCMKIERTNIDDETKNSSMKYGMSGMTYAEIAKNILRDKRKKTEEDKEFKNFRKKILSENDFDRTRNVTTNRTWNDTTSGARNDTTNNRTRNVTTNDFDRSSCEKKLCDEERHVIGYAR